MSGFVRLSRLDEIPTRSSRIVDHDGQKVLLVHLEEEVRAYNGRCPHARTVLAAGPLVEGEFVECPMHGAMFRADDGALEPGPVNCPGLTAWPVTVDDGHIAVDVPDKPKDQRPAWRPPAWNTTPRAAQRSADH
ncbi:Rieske (2Fe-2S) protein [Blastococcus sp. SYSU D00820]